jgi:hypothetical protein
MRWGPWALYSTKVSNCIMTAFKWRQIWSLISKELSQVCNLTSKANWPSMLCHDTLQSCIAKQNMYKLDHGQSSPIFYGIILLSKHFVSLFGLNLLLASWWPGYAIKLKEIKVSGCTSYKKRHHKEFEGITMHGDWWSQNF